MKEGGIEERKRKVWLVTTGEPLPLEANSRSMRCQLLALTLAQRGCEVTWWTSDFNHFKKCYHPIGGARELGVGGYRLRFLHGRPYRKNISIARQLNHSDLARDFAAQAIHLPRPDAVVCSFPPIELALAASRFATAAGIPFVLDTRDLWPDEMVARVPSWLWPVARIALSPLTAMVRETASNATALLGVSQRYLDWALRHSGRKAGQFDRVFPLGYPDNEEAAAIRRSRESGPPASTAEPLRLLFVGSLNRSVDLFTVIAAIKRAPALDCRLTVCGTGEIEETLRRAAFSDARIDFTGWVGADEIRKRAELSHVGLVTYRKDSLVVMPNKLFEYLSFGLPLINALPGEAQILIDEAGIGWNYSAESIPGFLNALEACSRAFRENRLPYSAASKTFEQGFEADGIYASYADLVEHLPVPD